MGYFDFQLIVKDRKNEYKLTDLPEIIVGINTQKERNMFREFAYKHLKSIRSKYDIKKIVYKRNNQTYASFVYSLL